MTPAAAYDVHASLQHALTTATHFLRLAEHTFMLTASASGAAAAEGDDEMDLLLPRRLDQRGSP